MSRDDTESRFQGLGRLVRLLDVRCHRRDTHDAPPPGTRPSTDSGFWGPRYPPLDHEPDPRNSAAFANDLVLFRDRPTRDHDRP